jgi:hypothetical protein
MNYVARISIKKACTVPIALFSNCMRAFFVAYAMCGVTMQFFALQRGLAEAGGSVQSTSTAAPAIRPEFRASARSFSTIN